MARAVGTAETRLDPEFQPSLTGRMFRDAGLSRRWNAGLFSGVPAGRAGRPTRFRHRKPSGYHAGARCERLTTAAQV